MSQTKKTLSYEITTACLNNSSNVSDYKTHSNIYSNELREHAFIRVLF